VGSQRSDEELVLEPQSRLSYHSLKFAKVRLKMCNLLTSAVIDKP